MQNNILETTKRFYSPQFSAIAAVSVRRLAWALGKSMIDTMDYVVMRLPSIIDQAEVCKSCRDNSRCSFCAFSLKN